MYNAEFRNMVLAAYARMIEEEFFSTAESLLAVLSANTERESFRAEIDAAAERTEALD